MKDKLNVEDVVNRMLLAVDERRWDDIIECFAEEVFYDYSSLTGIEGTTIKAKEIVAGWQKLVPGFDCTQHFISNIQMKNNEDKNEAKAIVYTNAIHYLRTSTGMSTWEVNGFYDFELIKEQRAWEISSITLTVAGILGNQQLKRMAQEVVESEDNSAIKEKVEFYVKGEKVIGDLYRPAQLEEGKQYPAAIVGGGWTTVKEMMAGTYAKKLADKGFITLALDHRGYGESEGEIREYESPSMKIEDFKRAINFLSSIDFVDSKKINLVGVCASAGYMSKVAVQDERVNAFVSVAGYFHGPSTIVRLYGEEEIERLVDMSRGAQNIYDECGKVEYVVACSDTDRTAAMYGDYDYYLNEERGNIEQWNNRFAVMGWEGWLAFNPLERADLIEVPTLIVHSEEAVIPDGVKELYETIPGEKMQEWIEGTQFDFYDNEDTINSAIDIVSGFLKEY